MLTLLAAVAVVLIVSFFCSLAEAVLLSLNQTRLETLRQQGKGYAASWLGMKRHVDRPIAAILVLNTVANTGGATLAGSAFDKLFGTEYVWIFSLVMTAMVLLGTEITPKVLGVTYSWRFAPLLARPLSLIMVLLTPVLWVTERYSRMLKPRTRAQAEGDDAISETADLVTLARLAKAKSQIEFFQERIIVNAAKMRETKVRDAMLPSEDMIMFDFRKTTSENLEIARQTLHTRYPVTETGEPDGVVGYVNLKDIFAVPPEERSETLEPYLRGVPFVSPDATINQALQLLSSRRQHIAIVRDAGFKVHGMLTMEDILEQIIGDFEDEFDVLPKDLVKLGEGRWKVGAGVSLRSVEEATGFRPGAGADEKEVGRWLAEVLPQNLRQGMSFASGDWRLTVQVLRRGEPHLLLIERLGPVRAG
ncbi:MAG: hemolysin family protein [Verrucomicrobiia bacterium]